MPYIHIFWSWEEAFDKFGFGDGDGIVMTYEVANFIETLGYSVESDVWGWHNTIIKIIKKDDEVIMDAETLATKNYELGYTDPRLYLPEDLIDALDEHFHEDFHSGVDR